MHIAIIDYGSGNLHSAAKAFERAAREHGSKLDVKVTSEPEEVASADRIVLPGVGAFADCKQGLARVPGMIEALEEAVRKHGKPFLGICVGLQLMASRGLEHGVTPGLGWIEGEVRAITPDNPALKIPHMGWNTLRVMRAHALLEGIPTGEEGSARLFRPFLSFRAGRRGRAGGEHRLWRPDHAPSSPRTTWPGPSSTPRRARSSASPSSRISSHGSREIICAPPERGEGRGGGSTAVRPDLTPTRRSRRKAGLATLPLIGGGRRRP